MRGELQLDSVSKLFGSSLAVDQFSHTFKSGTYVCLLGPSGCGKSTTLRMIAGHESVSQGSITLEGREINKLKPALRGTSMMFQSYALFPHLSVVDNVAFSLKMKGETKESRNSKAVAMLELVHMESFSNRLPEQLSGGKNSNASRTLSTSKRIGYHLYTCHS